MSEFTVVNHANETTRIEDSRAAAENRVEHAVSEFAEFSSDNFDVVQGAFEDYDDVEVHDEPTATDGGNAEVVEQEEATGAYHPEEFGGSGGSDLPEDPSVADDPVDWLPAHFIDTISGVPTVNRKGYAVIASKYGVAVEAEPVTLPSETDFEYAEFRAVATTADGKKYSGFGSAHVDRKDGDDQHLLAELAETRAMKRATAWATGVGLTAVEEMKNEL